MKTKNIGIAILSLATLFASNSLSQEENNTRLDEIQEGEPDLNILDVLADQEAALRERERQDARSRKMAEEQELVKKRFVQQIELDREKRQWQLEIDQQRRTQWQTQLENQNKEPQRTPYPTANRSKSNKYDHLGNTVTVPADLVRRDRQSDSKLAKINNGFSRDINEMVKRIKNSEDEEKKKEIKDEISRLLDQQYEAYLDHHEEPLKQLESRLKKLREEFEARKTAKADLVKLRLDTIWYNAIGLGWPESNPNARSSQRSSPSTWQNLYPSQNYSFSNDSGTFLEEVPSVSGFNSSEPQLPSARPSRARLEPASR